MKRVKTISKLLTLVFLAASVSPMVAMWVSKSEEGSVFPTTGRPKKRKRKAETEEERRFREEAHALYKEEAYKVQKAIKRRIREIEGGTENGNRSYVERSLDYLQRLHDAMEEGADKEEVAKILSTVNEDIGAIMAPPPVPPRREREIAPSIAPVTRRLEQLRRQQLLLPIQQRVQPRPRRQRARKKKIEI